VDSPAGGSQEMVTASTSSFRSPSSLATASTSLHEAHSSVSAAAQPLTASPVTVLTTTSLADDDSDFETEPDPRDWRLSLGAEQRESLSKKEAKRQDVINGESSNQFSRNCITPLFARIPPF